MLTGGIEPGYQPPSPLNFKSAVTTVKPTELYKPYVCNTYIIIQINHYRKFQNVCILQISTSGQRFSKN